MYESMPQAVAYQLRQWGHDVDLLQPHASVTPLFDLVTQRYDAYVLKTALEGPRLSLLECPQELSAMRGAIAACLAGEARKP